MYEPVYMLRADLRNAVATQPAQSLSNPGKIYVKGDYIFVNEVNKGIHVIDNGNPRAPQHVSFVNIPGNMDLAVKGNVLYADSFTDLLALDISDPTHIQLITRIENMFPHGYNDSANVLVDYQEKWVTQTTDGNCNGQTNVWRGGLMPFQNGAGAVVSQKAPLLRASRAWVAQWLASHSTTTTCTR